MSIARHIIMTACAGIVLWLMLLVGGLIWAMFSTSGRHQRTDALWGAVYFETSPSEDGIMMQFGLGSHQSVLVLFLVCLMVCVVIGLMVKVFVARHKVTHARAEDAG